MNNLQAIKASLRISTNDPSLLYTLNKVISQTESLSNSTNLDELYNEIDKLKEIITELRVMIIASEDDITVSDEALEEFIDFFKKNLEKMQFGYAATYHNASFFKQYPAKMRYAMAVELHNKYKTVNGKPTQIPEVWENLISHAGNV
jgi:GTPase involved in cell partitioning and DNA repair